MAVWWTWNRVHVNNKRKGLVYKGTKLFIDGTMSDMILSLNPAFDIFVPKQFKLISNKTKNCFVLNYSQNLIHSVVICIYNSKFHYAMLKISVLIRSSKKILI